MVQKLCLPLHRKWEITRKANAKIAQLVEHNLAKVGVASSSLVFRSNFPKTIGLTCPGGGIGRHATLRG